MHSGARNVVITRKDVVPAEHVEQAVVVRRTYPFVAMVDDCLHTFALDCRSGREETIRSGALPGDSDRCRDGCVPDRMSIMGIADHSKPPASRPEVAGNVGNRIRLP